MGDLPGSPSVAPSPPFLHGSVGREPRRASRWICTLPRFSRMLRNRIAWASGGDGPVVDTARPEGGTPTYGGGVYTARTQRRRWPRNLRLFVHLLPFFSYFLSSFCSFLFPGERLVGRNPTPAREVADSSRSVQRRRGEERKRWAGSSGLSGPPPTRLDDAH
jgi:hypothetical protein